MSGIDARIPLGVQVAQPPDFLGAAQKRSVLAGSQVQNQAARQGLDDAARVRHDDEAIKALLHKHVRVTADGGHELDRKGFLADLYPIAPDKALTLAHQWQSEDNETQRVSLENKRLTATEARQAASDALAQKNYDLTERRTAALEKRADKPPAPMTPSFTPVYTPEGVQAFDNRAGRVGPAAGGKGVRRASDVNSERRIAQAQARAERVTKMLTPEEKETLNAEHRAITAEAYAKQDWSQTADALERATNAALQKHRPPGQAAPTTRNDPGGFR